MTEYIDAVKRKAASGVWETWREAKDWALDKFEDDNGRVEAVFDTGDDGWSNVKKLETGAYKLVELFAPEGFELNENAKTLNVTAGSTKTQPVEIEFGDTPKMGAIELYKYPTHEQLETGSRKCYDIDGAEYEVRTTDGDLVATLQPKRQANGSAYAKVENIPLGTYKVKATKKANAGYGKDPTEYTVTVKPNITTPVNGTDGVAEPNKYDPVQVLLQKLNADTMCPAPEGGASLGDAHYRLRYYDEKNLTQAAGPYATDPMAGYTPRYEWVLRTDDEGSVHLELADDTFQHTELDGSVTILPYKVSGPDFIRNNRGRPALPLGTYTIQEIKAPRGYLIDSTYHLRYIKDDGSDNAVVNSYNPTENNDHISDKITRGDFEFIKVNQEGDRLANVPFKVTSKSTGEWHILVTDKNGYATTAAKPNSPRTLFANKNDNQFKAADGSFKMPFAIDTSLLSASNSVWFGEADVHDTKPALPYDDYIIEELPVPINADYTMLAFTASIYEEDNGTTVDLGTKTNREPTDGTNPSISTIARDESDGDHKLNPDADAVIIDRVEYTNLNAGAPYRLVSELKYRETGEAVLDAHGNPITREKTFTVPGEKGVMSGFTEIALPLDATLLGGQSVVVFETLYDAAAQVVTTHEDLDDWFQTIDIARPEIGTRLTDGVDDDHIVVPDETVRLTDTVSYKNVPVGVELTMVGTLMMKTEDGIEPARDAEGNEITAETIFVAEAPTGSVEVTFEFDGSLLTENIHLVAYESLLYVDAELADHRDPDDPEQTVEIHEPEIGTEATDDFDGDKLVEASPTAVVRDTVAYENLIPGREYELNAVLMAKDAEGNVSPLLREDGTEVTGHTVFVPEVATGHALVIFEFDASNLKGATLVAYEELTCNGRVVAEHKDPDDEGQTVEVVEPEIGTMFTDATDGDHVALPSTETVLVDTVKYTGLIPGHEYVVSGVLMDKATGEPMIVNDAEVRSETRFTPNEPDGEVEVVFTFDATATDTTSTVAFETLTKDKREIAVHTDITDVGQTVLIDDTPPGIERPEIGTTLTDVADGDHKITPSKATKLIDTVSYTGLKPGETYTMCGILMDKATGKPLSVDGKKVTSVVEFTPESPSGSVEVEFVFDTTVIKARDIVAFEGCAQGEAEVAIHADLNDEGQTVSMVNPELPETGFFAKTGTLGLIAVLIGCAIVIVAAGAGLVALRRR